MASYLQLAEPLVHVLTPPGVPRFTSSLHHLVLENFRVHTVQIVINYCYCCIRVSYCKCELCRGTGLVHILYKCFLLYVCSKYCMVRCVFIMSDVIVYVVLKLVIIKCT